MGITPTSDDLTALAAFFLLINPADSSVGSRAKTHIGAVTQNRA
jgi:hypothetical protein